MSKVLVKAWRERRSARRRCDVCRNRMHRRETFCTLCGQERIEHTRDRVMFDRF